MFAFKFSVTDCKQLPPDVEPAAPSACAWPPLEVIATCLQPIKVRVGLIAIITRQTGDDLEMIAS